MDLRRSRNDFFFVEDFDSTAIPINQFAAFVGRMHKDGDFGFVRLFEVSDQSYRLNRVRFMECLGYL